MSMNIMKLFTSANKSFDNSIEPLQYILRDCDTGFNLDVHLKKHFVVGVFPDFPQALKTKFI